MSDSAVLELFTTVVSEPSWEDLVRSMIGDVAPGQRAVGWYDLNDRIMENMSQTPDEQARNAITARITAHIAAGWP